MKSNQHIWRLWSKSLHQWGIANLVAYFWKRQVHCRLSGRKRFICFNPILRGVASTDQLGALAQMLEEPSETKQFAEMIGRLLK